MKIIFDSGECVVTGNLSDPYRVRREWSGMLPGERWNEFLVYYVTLQTIITGVSVGITSYNFQQYVYDKDVRGLLLSPCPC